MGPLTDKNGNPLSANQQAQNLANSSQYREVTPQEAQQIANNGGTVVVAYDSPSGHGHTATVRPQGVAGDSPPPGGRGPLINDIGRMLVCTMRITLLERARKCTTIPREDETRHDETTPVLNSALMLVCLRGCPFL